MTDAALTLKAAMGAPWFTGGAGGRARLAVYEAGPRDGGGAPPLVLLHGFPELAYSWRHQLAALSAAGRRVLAPDGRGYGLSERPQAVDSYRMAELAADAVAVLDQIGAERAIWAGHDWGGAVAWALPLLHPERTAGVIALNTPFTPRSRRDPLEGLAARYGPEMYMLWFQQQGPPEAMFEADVERSLRWFLRRPPPAGAGAGAGEWSRETGGSALALQHSFPGYDAAADGRQLLTPAELAVFVHAYRRTGFRGGLNWYRNLQRNWRDMEAVTQVVNAPALMLTAELDAVLPPALAEGMERFAPDLETRLIAGSGHWTQQEKPQEVNAAIIDWLDRRFPLS